ncbi:MAG: helix-hairpin-helix domain-containing protein [Planctomycetes bacterium]|nr:helix-hairpin-helix domain-containing protein [Planctomycetota bacterium]
MTLLAAGMLAMVAGGWLARRGEPLSMPGPAEGEAPYRVDVNAVDWPELSLVPGLGGVLARRIVERRERQGPYRSLDELVEIDGIGAIRLREIRPYLTIAGESPLDGDHHDRP